MVKFRALFKRLILSIPYTKKVDGKLVENRTISFNKGSQVNGNVSPAYYITTDEDEIEYMRSYPGNKGNGGTSFEEVKTATTGKKTQKTAEKPKPAQTPDPADEEEFEEEEETDETEVLDSTEEETEEEETEETEEEEEEDSTEEETQGEHVYEDVTDVQTARNILKNSYDPTIKVAETRSKDSIRDVAKKFGVEFPNL